MSGVVVGIQNVKFALLTADTDVAVTYSVPEALAPTISATITTETASETLYADNRALESAQAVGSTTVELEISDLPTAVVNKLLGVRKNAEGVLEYDSSIQAPYLALLFEAVKSNGAKRLVCLTKGQFSVPEDSYETKNDGVSFQTKSITGTFLARNFDGVFKYQVDTDDEAIGANVVANWFTAVYSPAQA